MERKMKVFLSWSGDQSRAVAEALRDWLPVVLQYVNPWVSSQDIKAGARWADAVAGELEGSNFGILCLTQANLSAPWMLFEAGALSNAISAGAVCPYLLDIEIRDLTGPLSQFQAKKTNETSTRELLSAINDWASEPVSENTVQDLHEVMWPKLETKLAEIPEAQQRTEPQPRPESEILEELVQTVRAMDRRFGRLERTVDGILRPPDVQVPQNLRERYLLWVDDNPDNNRSERYRMERQGATITLATSTEEALNKVGTETYDVIISDMGRREGEDGRENYAAGYDLLDNLRGLGDRTPFIFYAGRNAPTSAEAESRGAFGSTSSPGELLQLVSNAVRNIRNN